MKRPFVLLLFALIALTATPAVAQDEPAEPGLDSATLEGLCADNTRADHDLEDCLRVVHEFLVPGSGPPVEERSDFGLGDLQEREDVTLQPLKVDWNVKPTNIFSKPDKGMKYVGVLIEYEAGEDGASYNEYDWSVIDEEGYTYDRAFIGAEPNLGSGDIRPNRKKKGWVTFEVPKNARWLEIIQTGFMQDGLYWTISTNDK